MAGKLTVEELQTELAQRGLSTTDTEPALVWRPESPQQSIIDLTDDSTNRKRLRETEVQSIIDLSDDITNKKRRWETEVQSIIDLTNDTTNKKRRWETEVQSIIDLTYDSTNKKRRWETEVQSIIDLTNDSTNKRGRKTKAEEGESKKEKIVTAIKKGPAVLDQWLPDHIKALYHVLQQGDEIYDAMLNQTDVKNNNNTFHVIQVLESDDLVRFMVYNRWGRVGVKGQVKLQGPYPLRASAIQEFEQQFLAKTKNGWSNRKEFICHPKSYTWLEMDYTVSDKEPDVQGKSDSTMGVQLRETKLDSRIAKFLSLISNVSMLKQQMVEIGYNAENLPLGKLSKPTILKGYDVLKRIADVIGQSNRTKLERLSSEFYTVIPHNLGIKKMREFVIDTPQKLKSKLEMVEALGEIELATKLLGDDIKMQVFYQRLHCELSPLEIDSEEFSMIATYMKNTHANTRPTYAANIVQTFRVSREGEAERFGKFSSTKNRMLLWHGSRLTNWTGILSQGLRIAPREAPANGSAFGKGVYFADMFSKSVNYCHSATDAVLLLCEVALGDIAESPPAKYDAKKLPVGKLSTKGVGTTAPDFSEVQILEDGVVVPIGKPKQQISSTVVTLPYNEYVVYNEDQIRMRYIVHVNFNVPRFP